MTKSEHEVSIAEEIAQLNIERPHVVILGAGASLAALPSGDRYGRQLPLMDNFVDVLKLRPLLKKHGFESELENFELLYSRLASDPNHATLVSELEMKVRDYFSALRLPESPTLYDHLLLSLRPKDLIATFNWDPLLIQAFVRNRGKAPLPRFHFLHGSVAISHCEVHKVIGSPGTVCTKCEKPLEEVPLLYPVEKKNYSSSPFIDFEWRATRSSIKGAFMLTVFGYGAPKSDVEAISLMKEAWEGNPSRELVETEILDIKPKAELVSTWKDFLFSHHYLIEKEFYNSWLANHPRRSCEAMYNCTIEAKFVDENPIPKDANFLDLYKWLEPLLEVEAGASNAKGDTSTSR